MTHEEKSTFRKYTITSLIALIPEFAFSWIVGKVFDISIWYVWIGLQAIKLVLWILSTVVEYALFHLLWKNDMIDNITSSLSSHSYPNPTNYTGTVLAQDFFYDVMMDDDLDLSTRLDAAQTHPVVSNSVGGQGFLRAMRMEKTFIAAIKKYHMIKFSGKDYDSYQNEHE